ncbi:MAG: SDR family oxidoreductase [Dehalococcoidia bacterium]|nr:SDR family oxidoreductase [Dehalococcoidia bacterium]
MLALSGRGVLLVGTRRIGAVIAHRLAKEGLRIAIGYRSSKREAEALCQSIASEGGRAVLLQGDLAVEEDARRMVSASAEELGDLSFVVNLASGYPRVPLEALDANAWDEAMKAARGSYLLALHAGRRIMRNAGPTRGHIIMFSDWAALDAPYRHYLPYLTAKAAIDFMTRAFAVEFAPHGILVNAVAPGPTVRPPELGQKTWERAVIARAPLKRESSAEEIAEVVVTLLKSETITGETFRIDSGRHLAGPGVEG